MKAVIGNFIRVKVQRIVPLRINFEHVIAGWDVLTKMNTVFPLTSAGPQISTVL